MNHTLFLLALFLPVACSAGSSGKIVVVPHGVYVRTHNPECGVPNNLADINKNMSLTKNVTKAFGPKAGTIVAGVSEADKVMQNSGGDIAGLWNRGAGRKDGASCAITCI